MCRKTVVWLGLLGVIFVGSLLAGAQSSDVPTLPQSAGPAKSQDAANYRIQVNDVLQIFVWKEPEISQQRVPVRPDGRISIPLVQDQQAAGLTPVELKQKLEERLVLLDAPNVTVIVESIQPYQVYVMGKVAHGGVFASPTPLNVFQALAYAGGPTEFAKKQDVRIFRGNLMMKFNYETFIEGKDLGQNIPLLSGDVVEVH